MSKFSTDVPKDVKIALQLEAQFQAMADEIQAAFRLASSDKSLPNLIKAVSVALDKTPDPQIGLSANCEVDADGNWNWDVFLGVDYSMTVIDSQEDYTAKSDIQIARVICDCWQPEWNT